MKLKDVISPITNTVPIPSYDELKGKYFGDMLMEMERSRIVPQFTRKGVWKGIQFDGPNIPSNAGDGVYLIGYTHPIDPVGSLYVGSTDRSETGNPRERICKMARQIMTGHLNKHESDAAARKWVGKHGRNLDHAWAVFLPFDEAQDVVRGIEGSVVAYYRDVYPGHVVNTAKPTLTLQKKDSEPVMELSF